MMTIASYDWDAFCNISLLQQSRNREDQDRLTRLLKSFGSPNGWKICASFLLRDTSFNEIFKHSTDLSMKDFFCFRGIEEFINHYYFNESNHDDISNMHLFLLKWIEMYIFNKSIKEEIFLRNKCIQILTRVAIIDYPTRWPSFFIDLISILHNSNRTLFTKNSVEKKAISNIGCVSIDFFLKFLIYWDGEVCSREVQTRELIDRNTVIKDSMRDNDIVNVIEIINFIITEININHQMLFKRALKVVSLYISWIDVRLIVTDGVIEAILKPLTVDSASVEDNVKSAALHCLVSVINKGMVADHKAELIGYLSQRLSVHGVWRWLEKAQLVPDDIGQEIGGVDEDDNDNCFLVTMGTLVNALGMQLIECFKSFKDSMPDSRNQCLRSIVDNMHLALRVVDSTNSVISGTCLPFVNAYLSVVRGQHKPATPSRATKTTAPVQLSANETSIVNHCLAVITRRLCLPSWYHFDNEEADDSDSSHNQYRRQLMLAVTNIGLIDERLVLEHLHSLLHAELARLPWQQLEAALRLAHNMADSVKGDAPLEVVRLVLSADSIARHPQPEVRLAFIEVVQRYQERLFSCDQSRLVPVILLLLSEAGLRSSQMRVVSRSVSVLSRIIKTHKAKLTGAASSTLLDEMCAILNQSVPGLTSCDATQSTAISYLYECVSTLLTSSPDAYRHQTLHSLISPLLAQLYPLCGHWSLATTDASVDAALGTAIHTLISHLASLCRGCPESLAVAALDSVLTALSSCQSPSASPGRSRAAAALCSFVRVLLATDTGAVQSRLPVAIALLVPPAARSSSCTDVTEVLTLLTQVLHMKHPPVPVPVLAACLPRAVALCAALLGTAVPDDDDEGRQAQRQLGKLYVQMLSTDVAVLVSTLDAEQLRGALSTAVDAVVTQIHEPCATSAKLCALLVRKVVEHGAPLAENLNAITYGRVLPLLIYLPATAAFNLAEAQFCSALQEFGACLRAMLRREGAQFTQYLQTKCLPELQFSSEQIMQFCQALNLSDKECLTFLKNFYLQTKCR